MIRAMHRVIGYLALFEIAVLFGFILSLRYQEGMFTSFLFLLFVVVAVVFVAYLRVKVFSYKELIYISSAASTIFILVVQILGFTVYPGLAKDMNFLSEENLIRTGVMLFIGIVGNFLLLSLVRTGRM